MASDDSARIDRQARRPAVAAIECPHRPACSACPRFADPRIAPAAFATLNELANAHDLPPVAVVSGAMTGFRLRARLAIRGRVGSPKVGLFALGTHRVVHVPECRIQHPLINRVGEVVRGALADTRVTSYSDEAHLGLARYLQVVVERKSESAQVVVVGNSAGAEPFAACLEQIRSRLGRELHSLWFNANRERSNAILGPDFENVDGPASVIEHFGGRAIHYPPGAFGQNNLDIAERIVEHVRALVPNGARVAEFYAGVGAIGLSMVSQVGELRINEASPHSLHGLALGISGLDAADQARIKVVPGPAGAACRIAVGADVVIADPPRKGLDPELAASIIESPPARFVYVSCALESLLRDVGQLTAHGVLRLRALTAFNLMPFTDHVETVACFERG